MKEFLGELTLKRLLTLIKTKFTTIESNLNEQAATIKQHSLNLVGHKAALDTQANEVKGLKSELDDHKTSTSIHVSSEEKNAWNAKATEGYVNETIQSAIIDSWEAEV